MNLPARVTVCEVGPRDGLQSERPVPLQDKIKLINMLSQAGLRVIEATSFVHPKAVPQLADADQLIAAVHKAPGVVYRALVLNPRGVERAIQARVDQIKVTVSATDTHSQRNANRTVQQAMDSIDQTVTLATDAGVSVAGSIAVAFWCPFEGPVPVQRLIEICAEYERMGMVEVGLADTAGMANPRQVYETLIDLRSGFPALDFGLHLHDTYGCGLANVVAALETGVSRFDASVGGLGGCPFIPGATGNIATEDLVNMLSGMGIETNVNVDRLLQAAKLAEELVGHSLDSHTYNAKKASGTLCKPQVKGNKT
jgi:hydroxymethylglutaryl-CoA lyase